MRCLFVLVGVLGAALFIGGCSTVSKFTPVEGATKIDSNAKFHVGEIVDLATYTFSASEDEFNITTAFKNALLNELSKNGLKGAPDDEYIINGTILKYEPGNAGLRWLAPGLGSTVLVIECQLIHTTDGHSATVVVDRSISAGGGFTIGAYKYVFQEVAEELVRLIVLEMNK